MRLPPWQQSCDKSRRQAILHSTQNAAKPYTAAEVNLFVAGNVDDEGMSSI
jgi:hypothetical protein